MTPFSLVGIRGACDSSSYSYYINDIPGISVMNAADTSQQTGISLLERSISNADSQFRSDFKRQMLDLFTLDAIQSSWQIGYWQTQYLAGQTTSGYELELQCEHCRYSSIKIKSVEFQPKEDFDGKVVVTVGNETTEYPVTGNAGQRVYLKIDQKIDSNLFNIDIQSDTEYRMLDVGSLCYDSDIFLKTTNQGGFKVNAQTVCDIDRLLNEYKELFGHALKLLSGKYFYEEVIMSNRITTYTTYRSEEKANVQMHVLNSRYEKELSNIVQQIKSSFTDQCCIKCETDKWEYQIP